MTPYKRQARANNASLRTDTEMSTFILPPVTVTDLVIRTLALSEHDLIDEARFPRRTVGA